MSVTARTLESTRTRVASYLKAVQHRCHGCSRVFEGETSFLQFMRHLDLDLVCRHEFEMYLDQVRADAGGA